MNYRYQAGEFNNYKIKVTNYENKIDIKFKVIDYGYKDNNKDIGFIIYNLNGRSLSVNGEKVQVIDRNVMISNPINNN
ncbi:hypothetical protein [Clostridium sp. DL-VIII]|uniref:hypothetical protein n=1 Tax=Clostridium sp. DL-VIII TaxID=641107 RepID=UPI0002E2CA31|nr:hypothetical protein [Clostridium sp. DL-VIII]